MIGYECPWCEHEVDLGSVGLAARSIVCPECRTQVELAAIPTEPGHTDLFGDRLPLAA